MKSILIINLTRILSPPDESDSYFQSKFNQPFVAPYGRCHIKLIMIYQIKLDKMFFLKKFSCLFLL